jgi:hypothetical protein
MNSRLPYIFNWPWGLYAPKSRQRASEDVSCPDRIGVRAMAASNTRKILSVAVFFFAASTFGTSPGGIGRVHGKQTNTVLCGLARYSVEHLAVRPRCDSLTKVFSPSFLLSAFHIRQILDAKSEQRAKRQLIDRKIDVIRPLPEVPVACFRLGFAAIDLVANHLKLSTVMVPIGIREQFIETDVNGQYTAICLGDTIGYFNPEDQRVFRQSASLNPLCFRDACPLVCHRRLACRNGNSLARHQRRNADDQVKRAVTRFDAYELRIQYRSTAKHWAACILPSRDRCLASGDNNVKCLFECLRFVTGRKFRILKSCQRCLVELPAILPQGTDEEINCRAVAGQQGINRLSFFCGRKLQGYSDSAFHGRLNAPHRLTVTGAKKSQNPSVTGVVLFSLSQPHTLTLTKERLHVK